MTQPLSVPHFRQSAEGYCLPACARMVLAYHGIKLTEQELAQKLGSQIWGTPSFAIQKLANSRTEVSSNGLLAAWAEFSYRGATLTPK